MTQISRDDVAKLAVLSSLQLEEAEIPALQADLQAILGYCTLVIRLIEAHAFVYFDCFERISAIRSRNSAAFS
ncbi:MAG: hypothetical protein QG649_479, partial [Patescibacteria group bacterium]|nr:hypothetical protein [Patescibacteria group bacterium]